MKTFLFLTFVKAKFITRQVNSIAFHSIKTLYTMKFPIITWPNIRSSKWYKLFINFVIVLSNDLMHIGRLDAFKNWKHGCFHILFGIKKLIFVALREKNPSLLL